MVMMYVKVANMCMKRVNSRLNPRYQNGSARCTNTCPSRAHMAVSTEQVLRAAFL